jgi:hypothetical protein
MINLNKNQQSNTFSIYPESASVYYSNPTATYLVDYTHPYTKETGSFNLDLLNTPNKFSDRLTFHVAGSDLTSVPIGQHTFKIAEEVGGTFYWAAIASTWDTTPQTWGDTTSPSTGKRAIDTDRAYVDGKTQKTTIKRYRG